MSTERARRLVFGTGSVILLTLAVGVAVAMLILSSHPTGAQGFSWFAIPGLGIVSVGVWLVVAVYSATKRRLFVGLVVAPLIGMLTVALLYFSIPSRVRFVMFDRPAFDAIVAKAPAPVIDLPGRDLTEDESYARERSFPGPCPDRIGTLRIRECAQLRGWLPLLRRCRLRSVR